MSKEGPVFPRQQFLDVFQVTSKIKNKLQPFIAEYKKQNMNWIITSLQQIHKYLYEPSTDIQLKFNSVFVIKFMLDTAEIILVNLIQIYFLPKLAETASFDMKASEEKRGTGYFASVGYPSNTPDIQKLSYNFVRVSTEIIQAAAIIKPHALYYADTLNTRSDFHLTASALTQKGWKPYQKTAYYKQGTIQSIAKQYSDNIQPFDEIADTYIDFYVGIFKMIVQRGRHYEGRLNPRKILQVGDSYITSPVIEVCADNIRSKSLRNRLNGLLLLNEFVKWGDIEAASQINCTSLFDQILREVAVLEGGNSGINRGKSLFGKLDNHQVSQEFYVEFLKAVQFWALCFPKGIKNKDRESKIKLAHDELRMKLKIQFPDDKTLKQSKQQFQRNMRRKQQRNAIILSQLQQNDPEYVSIIPSPKKIESKPQIPSKQSIPSMKQTPKPPAKETPKPQQGDFQKVKRRFQQAHTCLKTVSQSQSSAHQKVKTILKFKSEYEDLVYSADVTDEQLDTLIEEGEVINSQLERLQIHLENYNGNKISFKELVEAINPKKSPSKVKPEQKNPTSKQELPPPPIPSKPILQSKPVIRSSQTDKHSSKNSLNIEPVKHNLDQASISKKIPDDFDATPIKKMQQQLSRERFSQDHSSLPQISKKSLQKSLEQQEIGKRSKYRQEQFEIQPQSHKTQRVSQNLFNQQQKKQQSIKKMENQFRDYKRQNTYKESPSDKLLEEQFERDIEINKPKNIANVKGSYKLKPQSQLINSRPAISNKDKQGSIRDSRHSSRQSSRVDFAQSKAQKKDNLIEDDDDDLICMPEINPLELSFHDIGGYEQQMKHNKELSFKKCFQADKYLLGANKTAKMFWLEKDTLNLIKSGSQRKQSRHKQNSISIPEILSQKDRKYQQDMKYIQQQKNRKIKDLEKKVASLRQQGEKMTVKLVQQQKQLQSFKLDSSMASSVNKKNFYQTDQDNLAYMQHKNMKEKSLYEYSVKQKRYPEAKFLQPQGRLISNSKYAEYFSNFNDEKRKKNLLKNKQLLYKDDNIQFGCMSKKEKDELIITFYITPQIQLQGLRCNLIPVTHPSLNINIEPRVVPSIRKKKQEKIILTVKVQEIPFSFPQIQFTYNLDGKIQSHKFTVPCSFHKFVHIEQVSHDQLIKEFQKSRNVIRGEEVPYSRKLLKNMDVLCQFFPNGQLFRKGAPNADGQVQFGGLASWGREKFFVRISIKPSQFLFVQAVADIQSETAEYYISLLTNLLMKNLQEGSRIDP